MCAGILTNSDNSDVDILGANLYQQYISGASVPAMRAVPYEDRLHPQSISSVVPFLVLTGVHSSNSIFEKNSVTAKRPSGYQSHRDFEFSDPKLFQPALTFDTVLDAVQYILFQEGCISTPS